MTVYQTTERTYLVLSLIGVGVSIFPWFGLQDHPHWEKVAWIPFVSPPFRALDIVANCLLFAPLGASLKRALRYRTASIGTLAFALSLLGESLQLFSHSRFPSATDVVCNVVGAVAGALLAERSIRLGARRPAW